MALTTQTSNILFRLRPSRTHATFWDTRSISPPLSGELINGGTFRLAGSRSASHNLLTDCCCLSRPASSKKVRPFLVFPKSPVSSWAFWLRHLQSSHLYNYFLKSHSICVEMHLLKFLINLAPRASSNTDVVMRSISTNKDHLPAAFHRRQA